MPRRCIEQAFDSLGSSDLTLSRSLDGGYDLLGVRRPYPGLLDHAMSTQSVARDTLANAERMGLRCCELEPSFDLDTPDDLARLRDVRAQLVPLLVVAELGIVGEHPLIQRYTGAL